jgi:hypothetical protein
MSDYLLNLSQVYVVIFREWEPLGNVTVLEEKTLQEVKDMT